MPLELEFKTAKYVDELIDTLISEEIFNEDALNQEFVVDTEGKTYRVSKLLKLSIEERKKYQNIKFFIRLKEKPDNDAYFAEYNLEEFLNSSDKKCFVYNKTISEALINIHNQKTIVNGKKLSFQDSLIRSENIGRCSISKGCFVFSVITAYSNTYEALALFQNLKNNITYNAKIIDLYFRKLPFDKIMPNRALSALINIGHKNFIKNYCKLLLEEIKTIKKTKQKADVSKKYRKSLKKYINQLQKNIETNSLETALFAEEIIIAARNKLKTLKNNFSASEEVIRKYSDADLTDFPRLKQDLAKNLQMIDIELEKNHSKFERILVGGFLIGFLMIVCNVSLNQFGILTSRALYTTISILSTVVILSSVAKSTQYINLDKYKLETTEIARLNAKIAEILQCQDTIELMESYQQHCKTLCKSAEVLNLEDLKNEIPVSLRSNSTAPLSSSKYLLENAEKFTEKEFRKVREKTQNFKENKQEEKEEKQEDPEIKLPMDEERDARTTLEFK